MPDINIFTLKIGINASIFEAVFIRRANIERKNEKDQICKILFLFFQKQAASLLKTIVHNFERRQRN